MPQPLPAIDRPFTPLEKQYIEMYKNGMTQQQIADATGKGQSTIQQTLSNAHRKAAHQNIDIGYKLKGESRLEDGDGNVKLKWIKTAEDKEQMDALLRGMIDGICDSLPREKPVILRTKNHHEELANLFTITDYHLGMLAWGEETGADWDMKIAEDLLIRWFKAALQQAPQAGVGIFNQLGDFLHFDGLEAVTPTAHNILDADTRFQKLVRVAIKVVRKVIHMMLQRYPIVHVKMCEGNHDPASSVWLREFLASIYEDEPRVIVDLAADPYYCYEHGNTALFFHHGHKKKLASLDATFAARFRDVYGRTKYAYGHTGHLHHKHVIESDLMELEQHQTLAANDAYGARLGFSSNRSAQVITYHKEYGETGRTRITPEMVK